MRASPLEKGATSAYVVLQCTIQREEKGELPNTTKDVTGNKKEKEKKNKIKEGSGLLLNRLVMPLPR